VLTTSADVIKTGLSSRHHNLSHCEQFHSGNDITWHSLSVGN